jgi:cytosine/adenosine deaminase-related metal-dependent hydrolase
MNKVLITDVSIFDGSGADPFRGEVLVEDNRITSVSKGDEAASRDGVRVINGNGKFLMPGMTEAHTHFSWNDQPSLSAIQFMPPEEHILWCVRVAMDSVKQEVRFTDKHLGRSAEVIVAASGGHGCRSVRVVSG